MASFAIENLIGIIAIVALIGKLGLVRKRGIHAIPTLLNPITVRAPFVIRRFNDHIAILVVGRDIHIIRVDTSYIYEGDFRHGFPEFLELLKKLTGGIVTPSILKRIPVVREPTLVTPYGVNFIGTIH